MIKLDSIGMDFKSELTSKKQTVLNDITFEVNEGDCIGILGESGSGKTTLGRIITGLLKPKRGTYTFMDVNPYKNRKSKKYLSENISIVFQDYNTSVNPRFNVTDIIKESIVIFAKKHNVNIDINNRVCELLNLVGLDESFMNRYPHQLSGGQLQRVCIARALATNPKVILFDESISSLDAHTQVQIMDLMRDLQNKFKLTYIFITHDLMSVTYLCNKVLFLYKGEVTEFIEVKNIKNTKDEYAKKLFNTVINI